MHKVISNTTPILSLLKIGQLSLLEALYGTVIVPQAVWREIEAGRQKPFYCDLTTLSWIDIQSIRHPLAIEKLPALGKGEAEVLVLAQEIKADLVIIDETVGRLYAHRFDLPLTGTLGVLLRGKQKGLIPALKPMLETLRIQGIWISNRVFQDTIALAGESD